MPPAQRPARKAYPFTAFPALIAPVALYALLALANGANMSAFLDATALALPMPTRVTFELSWDELLILAGLVALFIDLLKSTGNRNATLINHALSVGVFVICLVLFLLAPPFVSASFFLIMCMALLDVIAGITITIIGVRRDVNYGS
ncbi:MAG: hypothetical protein JNJ73_00650 [Hyphomonadaceae bacterium]|nr:hypothetical protein [Hyphomonadaceae bacterium]